MADAAETAPVVAETIPAPDTETVPSAVTPQNGKTAAKPKIANSNGEGKSAGPTAYQMAIEAITNLSEKGGSSLQAITKYTADKYSVDVKKQKGFVRRALRKAVWKGTVIKVFNAVGKANLFMMAVPVETTKKKTARKRKKGIKQSEIGTSSGPLVAQFNEIRKEVEIPDDQYNAALLIMERIGKIFAPKFPFCKVYMLRHWYLKMWTNGSNQLLIFIDGIGALSGKVRNANRGEPKRTYSAITAVKKKLLTKKSQTKLPCTHIGMDESKMEEYVHHQTGMKFMLTNNSTLLVETQTCRLLHYLCTFDSRAFSVFTLIHFWARINNVKLAGEIAGNLDSYSKSSIAQEPSSLEWLIMFFLSYKGILPTPREVLKQPHSPVYFNKRDIGFSPDEEFRINWSSDSSESSHHSCDSEEFVLSILTLAQSFFSFCSNLKSKSWILNMRDGELIPLNGLMGKFSNKLTDEEMEELTSVCLSARDWVLRGSIIMLHPLYFSNAISFAQLNFENQTSWFMQNSADKIAKFLESKDLYCNVDLKSLLTVDVEAVNSDITSNQIAVDLMPDSIEAPKKKQCIVLGPKKSNEPLEFQFNEIRREVEIPDEQYNTSLVIMGKVEQIFKLRFPTCKVFMLRHWYLKMKTMGGDQLLFFLDVAGNLCHPQPRFSETSVEIMLSEDAQNILPCKQTPKVGKNQSPAYGFEFMETETGLKFTIVGHPSLVVETQTCQLLKYLCTFDSRALPFFEVIQYWATCNQIRFGKTTLCDSLSIAREPAALEWLIACFLGSKRIIPTPREILDNSINAMDYNYHDIRFTEDEAFAAQWKANCPPPVQPEKFALSILQLVQEFFSFLLSLTSKELVVNTKDGELVPKKLFHDFVNDNDMEVSSFTKLTREELRMLCPGGNKSTSFEFSPLANDIVVLHPLLRPAKLSFAPANFMFNVSRFLKHSLEKIEHFLESNATGDEYDVDLKSVLQVDFT